MPFAVRDGVRIYYRIDGRADAQPLIMVSSLGSDHAMWNPVMPALSQSFRVIRIDKRGHGASDVVHGDYCMDMLGLDVLAVADAVGAPTFLYAGVSIGGMIGIWLAAHSGDRVQRLVLANTSAQVVAGSFDERITQVLLGGMPAIADAVLGRFFTPAFAAKRSEHYETVRQTLLSIDPLGYAGCCAAIRDMNLVPLLAQINAPTLVIAGTHDPATPPQMGQQIAQTIKGARYIELPTAHFSHSEQPARVGDLMVRFLRGEAVAGGLDDPKLRQRAEQDRYRQGLERRKQVLGAAYVEDRLKDTSEFTARFQDLLTRYTWGELWTSPIFDDRTRRLLVLALCIGQSRWEEFRLQVEKGLAAELQAAELEELLLQAAIYCGVPAANTAFHHAQELLRPTAANGWSWLTSLGNDRG